MRIREMITRLVSCQLLPNVYVLIKDKVNEPVSIISAIKTKVSRLFQSLKAAFDLKKLISS